MLAVQEIVETLGLEPLPVEGGLFRQTYISGDTLLAEALPSRYGRSKPACTAIYYLLTNEPDSFSALHRLPTDEIWHFYLGDPVELLLLHPGGSSELIVLGQDLAASQKVQQVVPAGTWMGAKLADDGHLALMGTTMAPGYDDQDYEGGDAPDLERRYPDRTALIRGLTR